MHMISDTRREKEKCLSLVCSFSTGYETPWLWIA